MSSSVIIWQTPPAPQNDDVICEQPIIYIEIGPKPTKICKQFKTLNIKGLRKGNAYKCQRSASEEINGILSIKNTEKKKIKKDLVGIEIWTPNCGLSALHMSLLRLLIENGNLTATGDSISFILGIETYRYYRCRYL